VVVILFVSMVILDDLIKQVLKTVVCIVTSGVDTDSWINILATRQNHLLEGDSGLATLMLVLSEQICSQVFAQKRLGTIWESDHVSNLACMNEVRTCANPWVSIDVVVNVDVSLTALSICLIVKLLLNIIVDVVVNIENFNILLHSNILLNSVVVRYLCDLWRLVLDSLDLWGLN